MSGATLPPSGHRRYRLSVGAALWSLLMGKGWKKELSRCVSITCVSQETRIRATEKDADSKAQNICISNHYGGEEVTHTLTTDGREDTHRWMEAFWQHFYDMSKSRILIFTCYLANDAESPLLCGSAAVLRFHCHLQASGSSAAMS